MIGLNIFDFLQNLYYNNYSKRKGNNMKILVLNKEEEKALIKMLSDSIINGTCHNYYLTTILEKISFGAYEAAFTKAK